MKTPSARRFMAPGFLTVGYALCLLSPALGAPPGLSTPDRGGGAPGGSPDRLRQIAATLAARWKVAIVIDLSIAPAVPPRVPPEELPIDQALDAALAPLRHVAWRQLSLTPEPGEALPSAETLSAAARSLEQQKVGSLLIENPSAKRVTLFLKDQPLSPSLDGVRERGKLRRQSIYLIYSTAAGIESSAPERQFADLQRQQMAMAMPPEQRALAMAQMLQLLQSMPPASRAEFAQRTLQAGMRLWDSTPPAQRQEMIQQTVQLMQSFGTAPKGAGRPGSGAPPRPVGPPPGDPQQNARRLVATLTDRYHATFLAEPALPLSQPIALPDGTLPVDEALRAVTAVEPGIGWRRLYLTEAQLQRLPSAESLAAVVRSLEPLEAGSLYIENRRRKRGTLYLKDQPSSILDEAMKAGRFSDQPVYLLYSTTPAAHGGTPLERFADLQRRQIALMLQMSPDQMAHSMEQVIQTFPSADDGTRARLMGLPVMAGMMAIWFPQEAKERGTVMP